MWTDKMMRRLLELNTERELYGRPSESQMAEILSDEFGIRLSKNAIHGKLWRLADGFAAEVEFPVLMPKYDRYAELISDNSISNKPVRFHLAGYKKILHMADLHIPFQNNMAIGAALNLGAASDILVISEVMDFSSLSKFNDGSRVPLEEEIEKALTFFELISPRFEHIFIISGNHDIRVKRALASRLPGELFMLVQDWDMMELLARPFHNIYVVSNWWLQLGGVMFCHASKSSIVSMRTAVEINNYFMENAGVLGINSYSALIQAHTHAMGVVYRGTAKVFESGCLCKFMPWYLARPHKTVWTTGFITLELSNGQPILNLCREHRLESEVILEEGLVL